MRNKLLASRPSLKLVHSTVSNRSRIKSLLFLRTCVMCERSQCERSQIEIVRLLDQVTSLEMTLSINLTKHFQPSSSDTEISQSPRAAISSAGGVSTTCIRWTYPLTYVAAKIDHDPKRGSRRWTSSAEFVRLVRV